jgi:hypothetical protein
MDMSQTEWKKQVKNIHNLTPHAWLSENCDVHNFNHEVISLFSK